MNFEIDDAVVVSLAAIPESRGRHRSEKWDALVEKVKQLQPEQALCFSFPSNIAARSFRTYLAVLFCGKRHNRPRLTIAQRGLQVFVSGATQ